ncbi:gluconate 2-dehydrogenase subunit 3 family protein [Halorussus halophilus]|uniref:gluconate 2-dehydrogenase subunit 3 family protein n=1 Tax=Halorussus halophilus TaxID=2650975 RepID=UPI0013017617|nr:gluconate 2-dehydrogenase subunit 3 family protein [Halorussus halophilus]
MELTRRDALAALAAAGATVGGVAVLEGNPFADDEEPEDRLETMLSVAEVVYPSEVSGVEEFVRTYALGRVEDRETYRDGIVAALDTLDEYAQTWHDSDFRNLSADTRASVLDEMGVDTADPDPAGDDLNRVRYYVVNELLYALYTSPTGGKLVGIENPQGHPGGTSSYQRGPQK